MLILAFESSCDETAAAVVSVDGAERMTVLSSIVASQIDVHRLYGGVVPEIASRAHVEAISRISEEALSVAGVGRDDIDLIAVTDHPGLIGALLIAVNFAKALALSWGKPLVGVDHIRGHIAAAYLTDPETPAPKPPFLALAVSGGHTSIYHVTDYTSFRVIGETRDDAIGEAFDKIGRIIGLPYPAGAAFDKLAAEGFCAACGKETTDFLTYSKTDAAKDPAYRLPSPALAGDTLDFSFSGLKTAAINLLHRHKMKGEEIDRALFAARYTYEAVEAVAKKIAAAMDQYGDLPLIAAGGVAANSHLRKRLAEGCRERGQALWIPPVSLCGDNAAMIAAAGYYEYMAGHLADSSLNASAMDDPV